MILLKGNGTPRSFRLSLPALQRSITALGFAFSLAVFSAVALLIWNLTHFTPNQVLTPPGSAQAPNPTPNPNPPTNSAPVPVSSTPEAQTQPTTGFWSSITGKSPSAGDEELRKEMQGLRDDLAKLNAEANGRKDLAPGENSGLLQFFGPKNALEPDGALQVKNVKLNKSESEWFLDFEITNTDPEQKQVRGYIVVLAKTPNMLLSYPEGAFNPDQNIVLDFTKGETFGVSRLRPTRATFLASALEGKNPRFHVLLFNTAGKVVSDFHVE